MPRIIIISSDKDTTCGTDTWVNDFSEWIEKNIPEDFFEPPHKSAANIERCQWILREGPFIKLLEPEIMPPLKPHLKMRKMRCNRKGIGLRIKDA